MASLTSSYIVLIFAAIAVIVVAKLLAWPVKKIINDQVYEINRVDGENVKLKDIIL